MLCYYSFVFRLHTWSGFRTPTVQLVRRVWWIPLSSPGPTSLFRWPARTWWIRPAHNLRYTKTPTVSVFSKPQAVPSPSHKLCFCTCDFFCCTFLALFREPLPKYLVWLDMLEILQESSRRVPSAFRCFLPPPSWPSTRLRCATPADWPPPRLPTLWPRGSLSSQPKKWPTPPPTWSNLSRYACYQPGHETQNPGDVRLTNGRCADIWPGLTFIMC